MSLKIMVTLLLRQALKNAFEDCGCALPIHPPASGLHNLGLRAPLSIIVPMHSVHSILRVRLITGDEDSDGDDTGGDNDDDDDDSFEDSEGIYYIFLFPTR